MNIVTLGISIVGLLLSSAQWIYTLYCKRTHYKVSVEKKEWYEYENYNKCILSLFIQNLSSSPLIITRMYVNEVQCYLTHQFVGEHYFPHFPESDIARTERILSADFPINIVANSGVMHKIIFDFKDKSFTIGNSIEITVQTTNRVKTYKLYCPNKDNNFKL